MAEVLTRRDFFSTTAAAAAATGLMMRAPSALAQGAAAPSNRIRIALIGCGAQGQVLRESLVKIPSIEIVAICDIWDYNRKRVKGLLRNDGITVKDYNDYRELLAQEKDLQAAVVATPDVWHAPVSNDCMKAGLHVYCEKMMSNTVEGARSMVATMKETGKLLQIGHQRRSNPRYRFILNHLFSTGAICGHVTAANAQWNRAYKPDDTWPKKSDIPADILAKWGYANMHEFRNWRWFRKYGGGPLSDLGAHQIDIFNWFFGVHPKSVIAAGGLDYYKDRDLYDNAMVIYEYPLKTGIARAFYQVQTTTSSGGGYFEQFMGVNGTLKVSENPSNTTVYLEASAPKETIDELMRHNYLTMSGGDSGGGEKVDVRETAKLAAYNVPVSFKKAIHQPHLENFFAAIRGEAKLNCPGDEAFESEITIFKASEAIEARRMIEFTEADFVV